MNLKKHIKDKRCTWECTAHGKLCVKGVNHGGGHYCPDCGNPVD